MMAAAALPTVRVLSAGVRDVVGVYSAMDRSIIPKGFTTCGCGLLFFSGGWGPDPGDRISCKAYLIWKVLPYFGRLPY